MRATGREQRAERKRPASVRLVEREDLVWLERELQRGLAEAVTNESREELRRALDEVERLLATSAGALAIAHALVAARTALRALADETR